MADAALQAPYVNLNPGPEYGDATRAFQGIPGIERAADGRLWATWYAGGPGEGPENYVLLATSDNDGRTWSPPKLVIDPPDLVRAFDPCLWHDPLGRLWLFWAQGYHHWDGRAGVWAIVTENAGVENPAWSEPRWLSNGIMMNKPTVLSTSEWLLPVSIWAGGANCKGKAPAFDMGDEIGANVVCSTDQGQTWRLWGQAHVPEPSADEHMIVERNDGSLWMLIRTKPGIGESVSTDRGRTWGPGNPNAIEHVPGARFFIRRLLSGKLLLVKHDPPNKTSRSHLRAFLSDDDGHTWYGGLTLDERDKVSYPDGVQAPDGTIYIIYDYNRRGDKEILMAVFLEEDVARGEPASPQTRLRVLVNKATGTPEP